MNLSVVIPTINSASHIEHTVMYIEDFLRKSSIKKYEIILAAQTSKDNTFDIIKKLKSKSIVPLFIQPVGKGIGLTEGIKVSTYDWILMIDDDLSYPVEFLSSAIKFTSNFDIIIGSRYVKRQNIPLKRKLASYFYRKLAKFLFSIPQEDIQSGLKLIKKSVFDKIDYPEQIGWVWDTEFLYKTNNVNLKIIEVPIDYNFVENTLRLKRVAPNMLKDLLKLRIKYF